MLKSLAAMLLGVEVFVWRTATVAQPEHYNVALLYSLALGLQFCSVLLKVESVWQLTLDAVRFKDTAPGFPEEHRVWVGSCRGAVFFEAVLLRNHLNHLVGEAGADLVSHGRLQTSSKRSVLRSR